MLLARRAVRLVLLFAIAGLAAPAGTAARENGDKDKKPSLSLKATPTISFSPARIFLTAELKGGADDYEEFYCATVEWDWGDGTRSEASTDCDPYEAGKSEIKRRFVVEHVYRQAGNYRVQFRLKKKNRPIAAVSATVQVKPGFRDPTIGF